jgi:hypothetical protein
MNNKRKQNREKIDKSQGKTKIIKIEKPHNRGK